MHSIPPNQGKRPNLAVAGCRGVLYTLRYIGTDFVVNRARLERTTYDAEVKTFVKLFNQIGRRSDKQLQISACPTEHMVF